MSATINALIKYPSKLIKSFDNQLIRATNLNGRYLLVIFKLNPLGKFSTSCPLVTEHFPQMGSNRKLITEIYRPKLNK